MKKIVLPVIVILVIVIVGFRQQQPKVSVAVAANVQFAMQQLKAQFEKETGIELDVSIGSSGKFTTQIEQGAPFDVFVSADVSYPTTLYKEGLTADSPKVYANGSLVLWTARTDLKPVADCKLLLTDDIKKIAIANPKTAPYGVAAVEALKYYSLYDQVQPKLVYGESIAQTNQYITTLSADIGFTAKSVVLADEMKGEGSWVDIDPKAYSPIAQAAVVLKHGKDTNADAAQKFYNYLYSDEAKTILKQYGYIVK
jgi:molybdate transport system substrate-binding protein